MAIGVARGGLANFNLGTNQVVPFGFDIAKRHLGQGALPDFLALLAKIENAPVSAGWFLMQFSGECRADHPAQFGTMTKMYMVTRGLSSTPTRYRYSGLPLRVPDLAG
jgi:hypothetical protein